MTSAVHDGLIEGPVDSFEDVERAGLAAEEEFRGSLSVFEARDHVAKVFHGVGSYSARDIQ